MRRGAFYAYGRYLFFVFAVSCYKFHVSSLLVILPISKISLQSNFTIAAGRRNQHGGGGTALIIPPNIGSNGQPGPNAGLRKRTCGVPGYCNTAEVARFNAHYIGRIVSGGSGGIVPHGKISALGLQLPKICD